jgi:hypothetical protein
MGVCPHPAPQDLARVLKTVGFGCEIAGTVILFAVFSLERFTGDARVFVRVSRFR